MRIGNAGCFTSRLTSVSMCNERKIILKSDSKIGDKKHVSNTKHKVCIHSDRNLISYQIVVVSFNCISPYKSSCKMYIVTHWSMGLTFLDM